MAVQTEIISRKMLIKAVNNASLTQNNVYHLDCITHEVQQYLTGADENTLLHERKRLSLKGFRYD